MPIQHMIEAIGDFGCKETTGQLMWCVSGKGLTEVPMSAITDNTNTVEDIITRVIIILIIAEILHKDLKMLTVVETRQTKITEVETEITYILQIIRKTPTNP